MLKRQHDAAMITCPYSTLLCHQIHQPSVFVHDVIVLTTGVRQRLCKKAPEHSILDTSKRSTRDTTLVTGGAMMRLAAAAPPTTMGGRMEAGGTMGPTYEMLDEGPLGWERDMAA